MAADLSARGVSKSYGGALVLRDVSLDVPGGSYVVLLGPSGSGKTTLLSILGGFTPPSAGSVTLGGRDVTHLAPARRPTATVFQDYALFPHLTVAGNVGFGLSVRRRPKAEIAAATEAALALVGLDGFGPRRISEASGGQRQRIALARALVTGPDLLLLDEPLGALDLGLRRQMQDELRRLQRREGTSFVHVTHDQEEAMALADLLVILRDGRIEDAGAPERVYARPRTRFAATFMGEGAILPATIAGGRAETALGSLPVEGEGAHLAIRPENLSLVPVPGGHPLGAMVIEERVFQGAFARLSGRIGGTVVRVRAAPGEAPSPCETVMIWLRPGGAVALED